MSKDTPETDQTRAAKLPESVQPQNKKSPTKGKGDASSRTMWNSGEIFAQMQRIAAEMTPPPYARDSRMLDSWMADFIHSEGHLSAVHSQARSLARNRGYELRGGKVSVNYVKRLFTNADWRNGSLYGDGWRSFFGKVAHNYYLYNIGSVIEVARDKRTDRITGLWSTDSTLMKLTGNVDTPLQYSPYGSNVQKWPERQFLRMVPHEGTREKYRGLGESAVYRCLEVARTMAGISNYEQESLMAKAPFGILMFNGMDKVTFDEQASEAADYREQVGADNYGNVYIFFANQDSNISDQELKAEFLRLATMPPDLNRDAAVSWAMRFYALAFGYDVREFWGNDKVGALFQSGEGIREGRELATQKGDANLFLHMQDLLNREIGSVHMAFEERSDKGKLTDAEVNRLYVQTVIEMTKSEQGEQPLLNLEQAREWLVHKGVLDASHLKTDEDITLDDEASEARQRQAFIRKERDFVRGTDKGRIAAEYTPSDPYIVYQSIGDRYSVIYDRCDQIARPAVWTGFGTGGVQRVAIDQARAVLFVDDDDEFQVTDEDVDAAITNADARLGEAISRALTAEDS